MGLLKDFRNYRASDSIDNNGLSNSTTYDNCDRCQYRMNDPKSSYWVCAHHKIHVSSKQICGLFSRGDPLYTLR